MLRRLLVAPTTAAAAAGRPRAPMAAASTSILAPPQPQPQPQPQQQQRRPLSSSEGDAGADAQSAESAARETRMRDLLQEKLQPTKLVVQDISGGCGAMYNMEVESPLFKGKSLVAQHRMVNEVLAKEIAEMHGLSLKTRASK